MATKAKIIITAAFVLALLAGVALGVFADRAMPAPVGRDTKGHRGGPGGPGGPGGGPGRLAEELKLTPDQRKQMDEIWSGFVREHDRRGQSDKWRELQRQREDAVVALLTPEQKTEYDRIQAEHQRRIDELGRARERAFEDAVEKTKQILNTEQRTKYEEILARRRADRERGGDKDKDKDKGRW